MCVNMYAGCPFEVVGHGAEVEVPVVYKDLGIRPELMFRCKVIDCNNSMNYIYSQPVQVKIETGMWLLDARQGQLRTSTCFYGCFSLVDR